MTLRKMIQAAFVLFFIAAIALPGLNTNLKRGQKSEIDNRMLYEWPSLTDLHGLHIGLARALNDRIGFRKEMILSYQKINDGLFGLMMHPSYMYGKEGYVYFRGRDYINGYQNIYNKQQVEDAALYVKNISDYLASRGIDFCYFLIPDKKTVYSEYFPDSINKSAEIPQIDAMLNRVGELGINHLSPLDTFLKMKKNVQLYNVKYDAGHWNADGAIVGISMLIDRVREKHPDVPPLDRGKYDYGTVKMTSLPVSEYKIDEDVPVYTLKKQYDHSVLNEDMRREVPCEKGQVCNVYDNIASRNEITALIFHDSYFANGMYHKFFTESFKRTIFIHSNNLYNLVYYLNIFSPDIVILENVERVIDVSSMLFGKKKRLDTYLPPKNHIAPPSSASPSAEVKVTDINRGNSVTTITGNAAADGAVSSVYARIDGKIYSCRVDDGGHFILTLPNGLLRERDELELIPVGGGDWSAFRPVLIKLRT